MIDYECDVCGQGGLTRRDILGNGDDEGHGLAHGGECWDCYRKRPAQPIGVLVRKILAFEPDGERIRVLYLDGGSAITIGHWTPGEDTLAFVPMGDQLWSRVTDHGACFARARECQATGKNLALQVDVRTGPLEAA